MGQTDRQTVFLLIFRHKTLSFRKENDSKSKTICSKSNSNKTHHTFTIRFTIFFKHIPLLHKQFGKTMIFIVSCNLLHNQNAPNSKTYILFTQVILDQWTQFEQCNKRNAFCIKTSRIFWKNNLLRIGSCRRACFIRHQVIFTFYLLLFILHNSACFK
jgi:hypothetical protein